MSAISGGFKIVVYVLGPLWVSTLFGAGPEFCEQSGIYNGLMTEQHLWDPIWYSYEDSWSWIVMSHE